MTASASCHCGACVIGLVSAPEQVTHCNCSICRRYGVLWAYYQPADVDLSGLGPTQTYMWDDRSIAFHRCAGCGCVTHWAPVDPARNRMGVNARLLPLETLAAATERFLDGAVTERYRDEPAD
ncbi:MAG: GFA family protein [Pseudomonadota bacterium]